MNRLAILPFALALAASVTATPFADAPARVREPACSDGTTLTGHQVVMGGGQRPAPGTTSFPGTTPRPSPSTPLSSPRRTEPLSGSQPGTTLSDVPGHGQAAHPAHS